MISSRTSLSGRRGMVIVVALFFAFSLMILVAGMLYQHKNVSGRNRLSLENQQAFFAARAAIQHLLLKAKLFPTELYDSVEFTTGKSPLCDFTEFTGSENFQLVTGFSGVYFRIKPEQEKAMDGKPKYFYLKVPGANDIYLKMGSFYNPEYRYLEKGLVDPDPSKKYTSPKAPKLDYSPRKFLDYYVRDCTNTLVDGKHLQPSLEMPIADNLPTVNSWKISTSDKYPYTMTYKVNKINLQAMKELRRYNEEAIEIEVEGSIIDVKFNPAKPDKGGRYSQVQRKVQKITRRGPPP
ncbi:hypothetical protein AUK22_00780 [bacterium CG2_30_54_10]|nr:MAG: hypothetical protein AUK22_00780 [bacterium CG2_30_54_10]